MNLHYVRQACLWLLPLLLLLTLGAKYYLANLIADGQGSDWLHSVYIVLLTANIGYFTNYVAIKMLFKPYRKTALGRQGLIPKNQAKLAVSLADTLSEHFLSQQHWQAYLEKSDFLPKLLHSFERDIAEWISSADHQQEFCYAIADLIESNPEQVNQSFAYFQQHFAEQATEHLDLNRMLVECFAWIDQAFEHHPQQMERWIEPLVNTLAENIPWIAKRLVDVVDEHIEKQDTIKRSVAKAARWSVNLSDQDVKEYLFRMIASPEFRASLLSGLQNLVQQYQHLLATQSSSALDPQPASVEPQTQINLQSITDWIKQMVANKLSSFNFSQALARTLRNTETHGLISNWVTLWLPPVFRKVELILISPAIKSAINRKLAEVIEHLDLKKLIEQQANTFSAQKLESLFQTMIADQLVFIELLGALLGALSGLALVNMSWFCVGVVSLIGVFGLDYLLTRRRDSRSTDKTQCSAAEGCN